MGQYRDPQLTFSVFTRPNPAVSCQSLRITSSVSIQLRAMKTHTISSSVTIWQFYEGFFGYKCWYVRIVVPFLAKSEDARKKWCLFIKIVQTLFEEREDVVLFFIYSTTAIRKLSIWSTPTQFCQRPRTTTTEERFLTEMQENYFPLFSGVFLFFKPGQPSPRTTFGSPEHCPVPPFASLDY